jgi:hypothetical protein
MKKVFALMLSLALMGMVGGCLTDSDSDDDSGSDGTNTDTSSGSTVGTYMPFKQASVWNYDETQTEYWSNPPSVFTLTSTTTCTGQTTKNGKSYWAMDEGDGSTMYLRVQGNDVYTWGADMWYGAAKIARPAQQETENLLFRFGVSTGTTWNVWSYTDNSQTGYPMTVSVKGKYTAKEKVTTPAGSYSNCMKFDVSTTISSTSAGMSYSYTATTSFWFAPNVGVVRTLNREEQAGVAMFQYESLLTSYVP